MKTYCELYFSGTSDNLRAFVKELKAYINGDWRQVEQSERWEDYLFIDYIGTDVDKARVSIYLGNDLAKGQIKVGNIVPLEKNSLSIDEYNSVLKKFNRDIIEPYKRHNHIINISELTSDEFDPLTVISKVALQKLRAFCVAANKSTGSSHPCDQERWYEFICQTVEDGRIFDYETLATFLQDESYWGKKEKGDIGVMGSYAWDSEHAYELADEYEAACSVLNYYRKTRGI